MDTEIRVIGETKVCVCCKREWTISYFHKSTRSKDGLNSTCKRCRYEQCKRSRSKTKEAHDKSLQVMKNWRDKNPNYFKERYLRLKEEQNEHHSS